MILANTTEMYMQGYMNQGEWPMIKAYVCLYLTKNRNIDEQYTLVLNIDCRYDVILGSVLMDRLGILYLSISNTTLERQGNSIPLYMPPNDRTNRRNIQYSIGKLPG